MTTLLLVRHGETDWNHDRRIQGSTDIPLNDTGRRQARAAADSVRTLVGDETPIVVASDLSRAKETAQLLAEELGTMVARLYPRLRERSYGEAEGLDLDEYAHRYGLGRPAGVPGAESDADLRLRAVAAVREVVRDARRDSAPASAPVVAVTHGGFIREVLRHASADELPLPGERVLNGAVFPFLVERDRLHVRAAAAR